MCIRDSQCLGPVGCLLLAAGQRLEDRDHLQADDRGRAVHVVLEVGVGRVYLPQEDLDRFGVTRADLAPGPTPPHVVELLRFEIARTRALYATARPGIELLHPTSRDCIRTAFALYGGILDAVEKADYQVLDRRVAVPLPRRLAVALPGLVRARRARRGRPRTLRPA